MCNRIDVPGSNPQPIPEEGVGWKIFCFNEGRLIGAINDNDYSESIDGWIEWNRGNARGFCAIEDKEDAKEALRKLWGTYGKESYPFCLRKIKYKKGYVGRLADFSGIGPTVFEIIVGAFRLAREGGRYRL